MYRVYCCPKCQYTDYIQVSKREDTSRCSLCGHQIAHDSNTIYKESVEDAERTVKKLLRSRSATISSRRPTRGLGVKKRILRMLESLIGLNKGMPITLSELLVECADAGIGREKALHFIDVLSSEGIIAYSGDNLRVSEGVIT
jgi:Zn ribbon nucleic-acid-binding protein